MVESTTSHPSRSIVLVIATLGAGGAERVMALLANEWVRRGNTVTLITLGPQGADHYPLDPQVRRVGLNALGNSHGKYDALRRNVVRLSSLRKAIKAARPTAVISFMDSTNILTLLATRGMSVPVIVSERIDPRHYPIARGWQWLRGQLYPRASAVVVQTRAVAQWAHDVVSSRKVRVIPNPVVVPESSAELPAGFPANGYLLAVGRLDKQKGFDILIRAYALLDSAPPLVIVGEGPERATLESLIRELNLEPRITLPGRMTSPGAAYRHADLFVLSSRFEGFPNVLLEAMAMGLPAVATDCPSGPGEIVNNEINGLLVPTENPEALAAAIDRLLADTSLRERLAREATGVIDDYSIETITYQWEQLLTK